MAKRVSKENLIEHTSFMFDNTNVLKRNTPYMQDSTVNKGQVVLKCTTQGTTANTTLDLSSVSVGDLLSDGTAEWEVISVTGYGIGSGGGSSGSGLEDWKPNHSYKENDLFVYENQIYKALVGFTSGNTFGQIDILEDYTLAGETPILWTEGQVININDIVEYDGNYYKALIDFTCGKEFTKTAFEEYVPKSLTDEEVEEVINSYNPEFSGGTGGENYSTEEQRIGTWIDGKPLYQITIQDTMPIVSSDGVRNDKIIDISNLNVGVAVSLTGMIDNSNLFGFSLLTSYNNSQSYSLASFDKTVVSNDSLWVVTSRIADSGKTFYATLRYTKTTD